MNFDVNIVIVGGNLTADPELKQSTSGKSVVKPSIAVHRKFSKPGEAQQTDFLNLVLWDKNAEFVARYGRKGDALLIRGNIQPRTWTDNSGKKQYATEIVVDEVIKLHSNKAQTVEAPPAMEAVQDDGTLPF